MRLLVVASLLAFAPPVSAAGDLATPYLIPATPFVHHTTTVDRASDIARYGCITTSEGGPEVVYRLESPGPGTLTAVVDGDSSPIDLDVHLLSGLALAAGNATDCLARGNKNATARVEAGTYYVVVDTYQNASRAGPYRLRVDLQTDDAWYERPVAEGVVLRTKVYTSLFAAKQTVSLFEVDVDAPGVQVQPLLASGCVRTSVQAAAAGAAAAVNGGFFDAECDSISITKIDGELLATNSTGRTAVGFAADGTPSLSLVAAGADWAAVPDALGGVPRIVSAGAPDVRTAQEGASASFGTDRHPRTAVGITAEGRLLLATVDGRTSAGAGMSLSELATMMIDLGAEEAMNLDGGGSTTAWAATEPFSGVVNYPSDNGVADHLGERSVVTALAVYAPPVDLPPVFLTEPQGVAPSGALYRYDLVAADPEGDPIEYEVSGEVDGVLTVEPGDFGGAVLRYTPSWRDGREGPVDILVTAAAGEDVSEQALALAVTRTDDDEDDLPDDWEQAMGLDDGLDDAHLDPDGDGRDNAEELELESDPHVYDGTPEQPGDDGGPVVNPGGDPGEEPAGADQDDSPDDSDDLHEPRDAGTPEPRCGCASASAADVVWWIGFGLLALRRRRP